MNQQEQSLHCALASQQFNLGGRKYVRVNWTKQEDQLLTNMVNNSSRKVMWAKVARELNQDFHQKEVRIGRQCKKRWYQVLIPLKKLEWTSEKEQILLNIYQKYKADTKQFYEECLNELKGLNKDQIRILLDNLIEQHNLQRYLPGNPSFLRIKTQSSNQMDDELTKKIKLNDSSVKNLCNFLANQFV